MYTISKEFHFSAAHQLQGLPETHPCSRIHGHNYVIIITLQSVTLNPNGFVQDYRDLDEIKRYIDNNLDHRSLNDVLPCNPTAENIARFLFKTFRVIYPKIVCVSVKETDKTCATFDISFDEEENPIGL